MKEDVKIMGRKLNAMSVSRYVFILPGVIFFSFAVLIPFVMGIGIAFSDWNGITPDYNFVGLENFLRLFKDPQFVQRIANSFVYAGLGLVGNTVLSLSLALLVNSQLLRGRRLGPLSTISRTVFFAPVCVSAILTSFVWGYIYREAFRQLFHIRSLLGMREWVKPAIVGMGLWNGQGINMLIYYSGLKSIPTDLYEAATVDGAGFFRRFTHVTLPMLMPSFTVCITLSLTSWFREFAFSLSATNGGPAGASRTIAVYIYENLFTYYKAGYGQAMAFAFALFLIIIGRVVSKFFRSREVEL